MESLRPGIPRARRRDDLRRGSTLRPLHRRYLVIAQAGSSPLRRLLFALSIGGVVAALGVILSVLPEQAAADGLLPTVPVPTLPITLPAVTLPVSTTTSTTTPATTTTTTTTASVTVTPPT